MELWGIEPQTSRVRFCKEVNETEKLGIDNVPKLDAVPLNLSVLRSFMRNLAA